MALIICPHCKAQTTDLSKVCDHCGKTVHPKGEAPVKRLSGKFSLVGVIILTIGVIGTGLGGWWGPAVLLPGVVLMMMAKFL